MKYLQTLLIASTAILLSACGTAAQYASSASGQRFQDGIYSTRDSFMSKAEKESSKEETDALIEKTKSSEIYLFSDKKDTIVIPENMAATIKFDKNQGTSVTVADISSYYEPSFINPYDIRNPYWYGSTWYSWGYSPWRYRWGYDPWYYGSIYGGYYGWYDPWYYGSWYAGYYDPFFYDPWFGY